MKSTPDLRDNPFLAVEAGRDPYEPLFLVPGDGTLERAEETVSAKTLGPALRALLTPPDARHDLSALQGVTRALDLLREELAEGRALPRPTMEGVSDLLAGLARVPEVEVGALAPPEPAPWPDPAELAALILDLALGD